MIITNIPKKQPDYYYPEGTSTPGTTTEMSGTTEPGLPPSSSKVEIRKDFSETFCWTDVVTQT